MCTLLLIPTLLLTVLIAIIYYKQDAIVKELITHFNADFEGSIHLKDSHISLFESFPYISIDLEDLQLYEGKKPIKDAEIVKLKDCYIGFSLLDILSGKYEIKSLKIDDGNINLIQDKNGHINIVRALKSRKPTDEIESDFNIKLKTVSIENIYISKYNETNKLKIEAKFKKIETQIDGSHKHFNLNLNTHFNLTVAKDLQKTFLDNKNFELSTQLKLDQVKNLIQIEPTLVKVAQSTFNLNGTIGLVQNLPLDLHFKGEKPNFNLFIDLAPPEIAVKLNQFKNKGKVYFNGSIKGESSNGKIPKIDIDFGCLNGSFDNKSNKKTIDKIDFSGKFTNGIQHNLTTSELVIQQFNARPEIGNFKGSLKIKNFKSPEVEITLNTDFHIDFLVRFFNLKHLSGTKGKVLLNVNFHDIIDLECPERAIDKLNESYYTALTIENLQFKNANLPITDFDLQAILNGHEAKIEHLNLKIGDSDLNMKGYVNDLPSILHAKNLPISCNLDIQSEKINLKELVSNVSQTQFDERVDNLKLKVNFISNGYELRNFRFLPKGEFFVRNFYAKFKNYPHTIHDFFADIIIAENDFKIIDFKGILDESDFHFNGYLRNYDLYFQNEMDGNMYVEFDVDSKKIIFDDLLTYNGVNLMPSDYRHEEIDELIFHGKASIHFTQNHFESINFNLSNFSGKMKIHPMRFEQFSSQIQMDRNSLKVLNFKGKMGKSDFLVDFLYHWNTSFDETQNYLNLQSEYFDIDEIINYNPTPVKDSNTILDHRAGFSLFDLPFRNLSTSVEIKSLNYHHHLLNDFRLHFDANKSKLVRLHQLNFQTEEGAIVMNGILNASDRNNISITPYLKITHLDLDKMMLKFDNFGQEYMVSDNLHGYFSGEITGKIHLHPDLIPKIEDSELALKMTVTEGKLENFSPLRALEVYFEDKNLKRIIFDTLQNEIKISNGIVTIPKMTINSTLGFMEISGLQSISSNLEMDYLIAIPWKMVGNIAANKLFKRAKGNEKEEDDIQYKDEKSKFIYVTLKGNMNDFEVKLIRKKQADLDALYNESKGID